MAVVPRALGLVASLAVFGTAIYLVYRFNKKKNVPNMKMDASQSSSSEVPRPSNFGKKVHQVWQLTESLFELYKPANKPNLEVLFFHGFQFGDYESAHISTWESADEDGSPIIWPQIWLSQKFPNAHILSIAYNCRFKSRREDGNMDLFNLGENLMADLLDANIGQGRRCPVVLVGHSFGGLVMKELCLFAGKKAGTGSTKHSKFLENVKGLFFYSTPHYGIHLESVASLFKSRSPLLENVELLSKSTSRLNDDFEKLRLYHKDWSIAGVGESCATKWDSYLSFMVVTEASSRYGDEFLMVPGSNHITISKPEKQISTTFTALTKFIKRVDESRKVTGVIHLIHGLPNCSSGLEQRVQDIQRMLKSKTSHATVLGIVGMGGIGKTTIAKQLFNNISTNYEYTCFVEDMKGIPIHDLEQRVLQNFRQDGGYVERTQWTSIEQKKTLIVMDDVDSENQLRKLPNLSHFGDESYLVITSRDYNVLHDVYPNCHLYKVDMLTHDEGKKFLCQQVFDLEKIEENHHLANHVDKVVRKCQGLPLTLEVTGRLLRRYTNEGAMWDEVISRLNEAEAIDESRPNDKVWSSLQVSVDDLDDKEREMFLDAATCFFGHPVDEALAAWNSKGYVDIAWQNLIGRSLVKTVGANDCGDAGVIWVHEQLRDLAKKISQRHWRVWDCGRYGSYDVHQSFLIQNTLDVTWLGLKSGAAQGKGWLVDIWCDSPMTETQEGGAVGLDIFGRLLCFDKLDSPSQETLPPKIQTQKSGPPRTIQTRPRVRLASLENMKILKYLCLEHTVPAGVSMNLPQSICVLKWTLPRTVNHDLPQVGWQGLHNLGVLHLQNWAINSTDFVEALGKLIRLRRLELDNLEGLNFLPEDFGNLSSLRELVLRELNLSTVPDSLCKLRSLGKLTICLVPILKLPQSFGDLSAVQKLTISECPNLGSLPESFGGLSALQTLTISECPNLGSLPESFGGLSALQTLTISKCPIFGSLPETFGGLHSLASLSIDECTNLGSLPESFGDLHSLKSLRIDGCENLEGLPESFGHLTCLERLDLDLVNLKNLPVTFGLLTRLEYLQIRRHALDRLPDNFGNLSALADLELCMCSRLEELPASFGMLSSLKIFKLTGCSKLHRLPESFGQLQALKKLIIAKASLLQTQSDSFGSLRFLSRLELIQCPVLESLPATFGHLTGLEYLVIEGSALDRLPDSFGNLSALADLELYTCSRLEELPASFGMLSSLRNFKLTECSKLQRLPEGFGQLKALKKLTISGASLLQALPGSLWNLHSIEHLWLTECPVLGGLPANFVVISDKESEGSEASKPKDLNRAVQLRVRCDGCRMLPIKGTRYKSITKDNFDLCFNCFETAENQADYIGIKHRHGLDSTKVHISRCPSMTASVLLRLGFLYSLRTQIEVMYQRVCLE